MIHGESIIYLLFLKYFKKYFPANMLHLELFYRKTLPSSDTFCKVQYVNKTFKFTTQANYSLFKDIL